MPQHVVHEYQATRASPQSAHVLKLAMLLWRVVGMANQQARHRLARLGGHVQIGSDPQPGPALEDEVVHAESVALRRPNDLQAEIARLFGKRPDCLAKQADLLVPEPLPLFASSDGFSLARAASVGHL